jgi:hypothetical protein
MPKRNHDGYVFFEDQHYLQKIGTRQFFIYSSILAERPDMVRYDPFNSNHQQEIMKAPGVDPVEHHSNQTKEMIGLSRDEVREAVKDMNRKQKLLWAIDLIFQRMPIHDLTKLSPSRIEIMKIIGPPVSGEDLLHALEAYRANPTIEYLLKEALKPVQEEPPVYEEPIHDPLETPDVNIE